MWKLFRFFAPLEGICPQTIGGTIPVTHIKPLDTSLISDTITILNRKKTNNRIYIPFHHQEERSIYVLTNQVCRVADIMLFHYYLFLFLTQNILTVFISKVRKQIASSFVCPIFFGLLSFSLYSESVVACSIQIETQPISRFIYNNNSNHHASIRFELLSNRKRLLASLHYPSLFATNISSPDHDFGRIWWSEVWVYVERI